MRDVVDQAARGTGGKLGIGVESDDVTDGQRKLAHAQNRGVAVAAQKRVQILQLAALALPPDPALFAGGPFTSAMKQQESPARVARVQVANAGLSRFEQRGVGGRGGIGSVGEIRKQSEVKIGVLIGEEAHFQLFDLIANDV